MMEVWDEDAPRIINGPQLWVEINLTGQIIAEPSASFEMEFHTHTGPPHPGQDMPPINGQVRQRNPACHSVNVPLSTSHGCKEVIVTKRYWRTAVSARNVWVEQSDGPSGPWEVAGGDVHTAANFR